MADRASFTSRAFNALRTAVCSSTTGRTLAVRAFFRSSAHSGLLLAVSFLVLVLDCLNEVFQLHNLFIGNMRGRERGGFAFEQHAGLDQFERADIEARIVLLAGKTHDICARADSDINQAEHFEGEHGFANNGAADAELLRKVTLGRHPIAYGILTASQFLYQNLRNLLIEPQRLLV